MIHFLLCGVGPHDYKDKDKLNTAENEQFIAFHSLKLFQQSAKSQPISRLHWFHGQLGREETERKLRAQGGAGDYLVRYSSATGKYVLSLLHTDASVYHYPIDQLSDGFYQLRGTEAKFLGLDLLLTEFSRALVEASGGIVRRLGTHVPASQPPPPELVVYGTTTSLHLAARRGDADEIRRLLLSLVKEPGQALSVDEKSADTGSTALIDAVKIGSVDSVRLLLEAGANTGLWDCAGYAALHRAAQRAFVSAVELLLTTGKADPQIRCPLSGNTPLHEAAILGYTDCATALLRHGAAAHPLNADGEMPYELALRFGFAQLADYLADWPTEEPEMGFEDEDLESQLQRQLAKAVWFHPNLNRRNTDLAMRCLNDPPLDGDFLVRLHTSDSSAASAIHPADDIDNASSGSRTTTSSSGSGATFPTNLRHKRFVLCLACGGSIYKYAIDCDTGGYPMASGDAAGDQLGATGEVGGRRFPRKLRDAWHIGGGPRFPSLGHLIDYLSHSADVIACPLKRAIPASAADSAAAATNETGNINNPKSIIIESSRVLLISKIGGSVGIGAGAFASSAASSGKIDVFKGRLLASTSSAEIDIAVKLFSPSTNSTAAMSTLKTVGSRLAKVSAHKRVVGFFGICCDAGKLMLLNELSVVGSAIDYVRKCPTTAAEVRRWCCQSAEGMAYLAASGLRHGRLAARNVLLTGPTAALTAKLSDFGLSDLLSNGFDRHNSSLELVRWFAPELLELSISLADAKPTAAATEATDCWSFGVLLWELHSPEGRHGSPRRPTPWQSALTPNDILNRVHRGERLQVLQQQQQQALTSTDNLSVVRDVAWRCMAEASASRPNFDWIAKRLA